MVTVAGIGQLFQHVVVVIAASESQCGQGNAGLPLAFNHILELLGAGDTDIEISVRGKNYTVDAIGFKILPRKLVGQLYTRGAIG